ncbi:MAG: adenosine kinase [Desulfosudaceae bacterium]
MFDGKKKITGIGSALVDLLLPADDDFVASLGAEKGGMTLVDDQFIEDALARSDEKPEVVSGGSACNTIVGVGMLGGETSFIGKCGQDEFGRKFTSDLRDSNVTPQLFTSSTPTGTVLSVVTPDAQRTMFTHLGASTELDPDSITPELFENTAVAVVEGYLLFNPDLMMATVRAAKAAGAMISLDLASFEVVHNTRALLEKVVKQYVDILIANEDEAEAYCGHRDEEKVIAHLLEEAPLAVLKVGERGSFIHHDKETFRIKAQVDQPPLDTTGAGDLWASGFLYGLVNGYPIDQCGVLGSACGSEVCRVVGAKIPADGWQRIKALL